ncbi:MAG: hypothetical protein Q8S73_31670 [Deltaproteobacteria bacterium]|nr:hypothetical protein [Myxococcales bacterium]MDP3218706.1 hypothetical protein [Deltaproteobacteria bacterium]
MTVEEIAESVAALSLDEARALVLALQTRLELEDPVPDWRHVAVIYGAPPWSRNEDEYAPHVVLLRAVGPKRALVISQLRVALSASIVEAKAAADAAPCPLGPFPDVFTASIVADALRAVGATVDVQPVT